MVGFDLCNIYRGSKSFCYPCGVLESKRQRKTPLPVSLIGALTNDTKGNGDHLNSRGLFQSAEGRWEKMLVKGRSDVASEMASLCYGEIVG
ncbi:hypothetical protein J1N35_038484 [Gossypium stocksii]|uniref:Uncharacterized protein n=1 Tax=Gossypium stocksii TaxID=47602 RepID=A0A9D3UMK0_9ROSI|nr:hypothetical protein J1N35_038484 [Gossypium stocksii]